MGCRDLHGVQRLAWGAETCMGYRALHWHCMFIRALHVTALALHVRVLYVYAV